MNRAERWWHCTPEHAHNVAIDRVCGLEEAQKEQHLLNLRHARLYGNCHHAALDWSARRGVGAVRGQWDKVTDNVIRSAVDTAQSRIARPTRARFLTDYADQEARELAKMQERWNDALFDRQRFQYQKWGMFRDAGIFGTGVLRWRVDRTEKRIHIERPWIDEIIVDELEAYTGGGLPRELFHRRLANRDVLCELFPDHEEAILRANTKLGRGTKWTTYREVDDNQVVLVEAWHLPSGPEAEDGRYAVFIDGATLDWEDYEEETYPFLWYHWSEPVRGFYGQGIAEILTGYQLELNKTNAHIRACHGVLASPRVFVPNGAGISPDQILRSEVATLIYYNGPHKPEFMTAQAVSPEIYQYKEGIWRRAFEEIGMSTLYAHAKKPPGDWSGRALAELEGVEDERFASQYAGFEQITRDAAAMNIKFGRQLFGSGSASHLGAGEWRALSVGDLTEAIPWKAINPEDFRVAIHAASILPTTPAGRLDRVERMLVTGMVDQANAWRLLDHPDLGEITNDETAALDDIKHTIVALRHGYKPPNEFQDLARGVKLVTYAKLEADRQGADPAVVSRYDRWVAQAQWMLDQAATAAQMQQAEPGAPGEAPISEPPIQEAA